LRRTPYSFQRLNREIVPWAKRYPESHFLPPSIVNGLEIEFQFGNEILRVFLGDAARGESRDSF